LQPNHRFQAVSPSKAICILLSVSFAPSSNCPTFLAIAHVPKHPLHLARRDEMLPHRFPLFVSECLCNFVSGGNDLSDYAFVFGA
jgi:hypothetical protein